MIETALMKALRFRPFVAGLLALACIGLTFSQAQAQSALCAQLAGQLSAANSGGGSGGSRGDPAKFRQYDKAVRDQIAQIAKTERASRLNGCFGFFSRRSQACDRIRSSLGEMNANLSNLQRTRDRLAGGGGGGATNRQSAQIIARMNQLGCTRGSQEASAEPRRRTLLEQIFGVRTYREDGQRGGDEFSPSTGGGYGTVRTLCVRKCDGYYFPVSFSTSRDRLDRDSAICQSMCPGTEVELYYHSMPNEESEDMISFAANEPYANLPTAFKYRRKIEDGCTCRFSSQFLMEVAGSGGVKEQTVAGADAQQSFRLPQHRPDFGLDPETLANLEGDFTAKALEDLTTEKPPAKQPVADASRKVRIVGPQFFPVQ